MTASLLSLGTDAAVSSLGLWVAVTVAERCFVVKKIQSWISERWQPGAVNIRRCPWVTEPLSIERQDFWYADLEVTGLHCTWRVKITMCWMLHRYTICLRVCAQHFATQPDHAEKRSAKNVSDISVISFAKRCNYHCPSDELIVCIRFAKWIYDFKYNASLHGWRSRIMSAETKR